MLKVENITDENIFFKSDTVKKELTKINKVLMAAKGVKKDITVVTDYSRQENSIAYTDNNHVYINYGNKFFDKLDSYLDILKAPDRTTALYALGIGADVHEMSHVFWTNFDDGNQWYKALQKGCLLRDVGDSESINIFKEDLKDLNQRDVIIKLLFDINNRVEDGFIEMMAENHFGGKILGCLFDLRDYQFGNMIRVEDMDLKKMPTNF